MKERDIAVGGVYARAETVRRIVDAGPHLLALLPEHTRQSDDLVRYEVLQGGWRSKGRIPVCSRRALAAWAKVELSESEAEDAERGLYSVPLPGLEERRGGEI